MSHSLLAKLLHSDSFGSVERSSSDWVELQVLLEGTSSLAGVGKALFLVMDRKEVKGGDEQNRDCEWDTGAAHFWSIPSSSERSGKDHSAVDMI